MTTPEEWLVEYDRTRYLRHLTDMQLQERYDYLASNLWSTDPLGRVVPTRNTEARQGILRLLLHSVLEKAARGQPVSQHFDERAIREASSALYTPPRLKSPYTGPLSCYAKFGKRGHIRDAFERGVLRIAPASSYSDESLHPAQRDNELEQYTVTPNERLMFSLEGVGVDGQQTPLPHHPEHLFRLLNIRDFYVWCCGLGYDARLFHEFGYDAALMIHDKDRFHALLSLAVSRRIPGQDMIHSPLGYYDPCTSRQDQIIAMFGKKIQYLYQNEYRFVWTAPAGATLEPFFVELGPLEGIAELIELEVSRR